MIIEPLSDLALEGLESGLGDFSAFSFKGF